MGDTLLAATLSFLFGAVSVDEVVDAAASLSEVSFQTQLLDQSLSATRFKLPLHPWYIYPSVTQHERYSLF